MELHEPHGAVVGKVPRQCLGQVRLARSRRPVEDHLASLPEQVGDLLQLRVIHEEVRGGFGGHRIERERPLLFHQLPDGSGWLLGLPRHQGGELIVGLGQVDDVCLALQQGRQRGERAGHRQPAGQG